MSVSSEEAKLILAPHLDNLQICVSRGLQEYCSAYPSVRHLHSPWSRATLVRDHIVAQVRKAFEEVEGIKIIQKQGLFLLSIEGKLLLRFKKFNRKMLTRNHPTQQAFRFSEQLSIPGFPPAATNINVGYMPNDLWTDALKVLITCPSGSSSINWYIDITSNTEIISPLVLNFSEENKDTTKKRIRAKNTNKNQIGSQKLENYF